MEYIKKYLNEKSPLHSAIYTTPLSMVFCTIKNHMSEHYLGSNFLLAFIGVLTLTRLYFATSISYSRKTAKC